MKKYLQIIIASKLVQAPLQLSKRIILPGFDGMPFYDVVVFFIKGLRESSLTTRASSLAFQFFLALFPSIIFLFTLIPIIPIDNFQDQLFDLIKEIMPTNAYELANETIEDLIKNKNNSLLSFGFIFALYFATNGINAMIMAFNHSYHSSKKGSFIKQRLTSFLLLFILTFLMVIAIGLIVFSNIIIKKMIAEGYISSGISLYLIDAGKFIILILLFFLGISSIYYYGNIRNTKFRFVSAGSTLATLLTIIISYGFAFYVNNFSTYNKVYGSIGTLIVIMLWLYFNSLVLLIGFELNASIQHAKKNKLT